MGLIIPKKDTSLNKKFEVLFQRRKYESENLEIVLQHFIDNPESAKSAFNNIDVLPNTRKEYSGRVLFFLRYAESQTIDLDLFLNYKRHLDERTDVKISTKNKYLTSARVLLKELSRQGFIQDITMNVKCFRQSKLHKKQGHTKDDVREMYQKIGKMPNTPENARLNAIFHLAAVHGLRQIEISRLNENDVDFSSGVIWIQGKGRDDKEPVHLSPQAMESLRNHIQKSGVKGGPLFFSTSNISKGKRLSTRSIRSIYDKLKSQFDITASMHGLRHFFTTEMIKNNVPLHKVQKHTRHKSLDMLQVYNDEVMMQSESLTLHKQCFSGVFA